MATPSYRGIVPAAISASGAAGAVIGGTVAAARDIGRVRDGEMSKGEAVMDIGKESVGTGLATAAGVAVVGALGIGGFAGLLGIAGVAAGTKYLWNKKFAYRSKQQPATAQTAGV